MPFDTDPRKRTLGAATAAPGAPAATPGNSSANPSAPSPAGSGSFVNFAQLYSLNQPAASGMAQRLAADAKQKGEAAEAGIAQGRAAYGAALQGAASGTGAAFAGPKSWSEAGVDTGGLTQKATEAAGAARNLATDAGRAASLGGLYGSPYAAAGASAFDAMLAGAAGGPAFAQTAKQYGDVDAHLVAAQAQGGADYAAAQGAWDAGAKARAEAERQKQVADAKARAEAQAQREARGARNAETTALRQQVQDGSGGGGFSLKDAALVGLGGATMGPVGMVLAAKGKDFLTYGRDAERQRLANQLALREAQDEAAYLKAHPELAQKKRERVERRTPSLYEYP